MIDQDLNILDLLSYTGPYTSDSRRFRRSVSRLVEEGFVKQVDDKYSLTEKGVQYIMDTFDDDDD